jgi:hypothetical protein
MLLSNIKIAAVSAVLSGLIVGIWDGDARTSPEASPKTFVDRVPETATEPGAGNGLISGEVRRPFQSAGIKGDRINPVEASACNNAAWPYIPQDCLHLTGLAGPRTGVRVITVETREGENTSILMRMPQTTVATR